MTGSVKTLSELIAETADHPQGNISVSGIQQDSRLIKPGELFVARTGAAANGLSYIAQVEQQGAAAVLVDAAADLSGLETSLPVVAIENLQQRMGPIAAAFYDHPSRQLRMIGITGTNGKTSCSHFIAQALNRSGCKAALVGTVGNGFPGSLQSASHTTPDAIGLQQLLAGFLAEGAQAVVMEVSSHALEQGRVTGIEFDFAAFTNLSRDHLDYHGTMEAYGAAKAGLFRDFALQGAVICADDPFGRSLIGELSQTPGVLGFGEAASDLHLRNYELNSGGIELTLATPWGEVNAVTSVVGRYNLHNLMLSAGILGLCGLTADEIGEQLGQLDAVPGRMQCLGGGEAPLVVIDYAHTPDALQKALEAVRVHTVGQLYCVFGCGGDRDNGKRPEMGRISAALADRSYVTSDNPRSEEPQQIIDMILAAMPSGDEVQAEVDRRSAIQQAITSAGAGDVVLIAGKGHENYQDIMGVRHHFDDAEEAALMLAEVKG
ncbi:UDP-N-acetylmuramoyl-L-alanyl-D-glutamate--2,6-diaminopimelate ligase [Marinobacterium jannaschii]|uniref:UDP-N-acetylmuramoyl-L-alanyl-D-glutamate--2, 6-diaminopimelate ligase n=1 Tax=Marinobacterium jannaschii TaxID=64970 RepID=UPI000485BD99|nr:UDP-N-acetylmuramoyl-L-alanyl-D-glutamate--2,6-diaminopimelate ligase [Marinobacterium jannaschii]